MASVRRQTHHPLFHPQIVRLSRSGMNLRPRGRQKGRVAPVAAHSTGPPFAALSSDAIRESLSLIKGSADAFPPLKSTVVGVLAVWDLVERVSASDENAQALARRVVGILDVIYKAVGGGAVPVSPEMLEEMLKFEELLHEISAAMEQHLKAGRLRRVLHLRRQESRLAQFTARLDAAAEAFRDQDRILCSHGFDVHPYRFDVYPHRAYVHPHRVHVQPRRADAEENPSGCGNVGSWARGV